jgi:hypothetical protein
MPMLALNGTILMMRVGAGESMNNTMLYKE